MTMNELEVGLSMALDPLLEVSALMTKSPVTGSCWRDWRGERNNCSRAKYLGEHIVNKNSIWKVS